MEITRQINAIDGPAQQFQLACDQCKRRKIKCDRELPACRTCIKNTKSCSYPLTSNKPGPKPGVTQRKRRKVEAGEDGHASEVHRPSIYSQPSRNSELSGATDQADQGDLSQRHQLPQDSIGFSQSQTGTLGYRGLSLSHLLHPSHEPPSVPTAQVEDGNSIDAQSRSRLINNVCSEFQITPKIYEHLLNTYFHNMTAFSIFHRPTFDIKLNNMATLHCKALLAAIFSFSARFRNPEILDIPPHEYFRELARTLTDDALHKSPDDPPPLCVLQALILVTFHQLISGVRSLAWRSVGTLIGIAYELNLHLIDKNPSNKRTKNVLNYLEEEKRRAWWAIWEFDVFASTIRRLPTSIDWESNQTWLPIGDELWAANAYKQSCCLNPDSAVSWKDLERSGNKCSKAWFIVLNALMRSAHLLSYPQAYAKSHSESATGKEGVAPVGLEILANSLYCLSSAIPPEVLYQGENLNFQHSPESSYALQRDSASHSIHLMTQLCRFMINHYNVFNSGLRNQRVENLANVSQCPNSAEILDKAAWSRFLSAASEIVTLVRNCPPNHIQYTNPFLASTIWLAAAAQIVSRSLGSPGERRIADSNLQLLQMNLNSYVSFWGVSSSLPQKLRALEAKIGSMRDHTPSTNRRQEPQDYAEDSMLLNNGTSSDRGAQQDRMLETSDYVQPMTNLESCSRLGQGLQSTGWSIAPPQTFDLITYSVNTELDAGMWGWGLDELLAYGGLE